MSKMLLGGRSSLKENCHPILIHDNRKFAQACFLSFENILKTESKRVRPF